MINKVSIYKYYILNQGNQTFFKKELVQFDEENIKILTNEIDKSKLLKNIYFVPEFIDASLESTYYVTYKYILGNTLDKLKNLSDYKITQILISIAENLEMLHHLLIVHGDIKPENIMIDNNFNVYLLDLGNASFLGEKTNYGTVRYCSYQQLKKKKTTAKFDIYSLGIIMYELFTKKEAYQGLTQEEILTAQENDILSISEDAPKEMPLLAEIIFVKATCLNVSRGYLSITEMKNDLIRLLEELSSREDYLK